MYNIFLKHKILQPIFLGKIFTMDLSFLLFILENEPTGMIESSETLATLGVNQRQTLKLIPSSL